MMFAKARATLYGGDVANFKSSVVSVLLISLGLAFSRVVVLSFNAMSSSHAAYAGTADVYNIAKCVILALLLIVLYFSESYRDKRFSVAPPLFLAIQLLCLIALLFLSFPVTANVLTVELISSLGSLAGIATMFFWLSKTKGMNPAELIATVTIARVLSEISALPIPLAGQALLCLLGLLSVASQIACRLALSRCPDVSKAPQNFRYFSGVEADLGESRMATASILCCVLLSFAIGLLQGYPREQDVFSSLSLNFWACLIVALLCSICFLAALRRPPLLLLSGAWLAMQLLGAAAVLLYSLFSDNLEYGAVFSLAFDNIMGAFKWYITAALINMGNKNPYYYSILIYLAFLLPRNLAQWLIGSGVSSTHLDGAAICAIAALLLIIAGQGLFLQVVLILTKRKSSEDSSDQTVAEKILGLNLDVSSTDLQKAAMRQNAASVGKTFGLSNREVEVLTLFALGHTQKRVSQELFISSNTAHAHIRHIYTKTGFHSRQEILDYMSGIDKQSD